MNKKIKVFLLILGWITHYAISTIQSSPGYMDADYYMDGGLRIVNKEGNYEPYLWNYLNDPPGVEQPSHTYWMPMASFIAAAGMYFSGLAEFSTAKLAFIFLSGFVPLIAAELSFRLTKNASSAAYTGLLSMFSGFYIPFLPITDTFAVYMLLGGFFLILVHQQAQNYDKIPGNSGKNIQGVNFLLGMVSGLFYLTRSDGLTWLAGSFLLLLMWTRVGGGKQTANKNKGAKSLISGLGLVLLGFAVVSGPWMLRNLSISNNLMPEGGLSTLWLTEYNEIFSFPGSQLTFDHWLSSGLKEIISSRIGALGVNLQRALAEQGSIFLAPLIIIGAWHKRKHWMVKTGVLMWILTLFSMSFIFPYAGARGGFFHSSSAVQPLWMALVVPGLEKSIRWGSRLRGWNYQQAKRFFGAGILVFAVLLTGFVVKKNVIGEEINAPLWGSHARDYQIIEERLPNDLTDNAVIMLNNPPLYYLTNQRRAIIIPYGDFSILMDAAEKYGAEILLVEKDHYEELDDIYMNTNSEDRLRYLTTVRETRIFRIIQGKE